MSIYRPKQPQAVKAQILRAAERVLANEGIAAFTFDRVLGETDLSKGGLQYHFRTKQALLDALFEHFLGEFRKHLQDVLEDEPHGPARHIRAYVRATCISALAMAHGPRAAVLLLLENSTYQRIWSEFVDELFSTDSIPEELLLTCRYAADGLWFGHVIEGRSKKKCVVAVRDYLLHLTTPRSITQ